MLSESEKFFKSGGNALLFPDHLPPDSLCVDFGGYKGDWVLGCLDRQNLSDFWVYEPVPKYFEEIKEIFTAIPNVTVFPYALANESSSLEIRLDGAATTFFATNETSNLLPTVRIRCEPYLVFKTQVRDRTLDWVKMNIEGSEYELIRFLEGSQILQRVKTLVVQFHEIDGESLESIHMILNRTHVKQWGYEYVWERWDVR
jgi:FkbM family methyltransferase